MDTPKKRVLIIEDDSSNIMTLTYVLSSEYTLFVAKTGERGIELAEQLLPDIILLDVLMPGMNGFEVLKLLKTGPTTSDIPVVFLTSRNDSNSELEGLSLGAIDYISKPFSPPLLLKRLEVHLLVESQKRELVGFNINLQEMVAEKTKTVLELKNAFLRTMAELIEQRDGVTGGHIERTQSYLEVMLNAMVAKGIYEEEIINWDTTLVLQSAQLHDLGKIAISDRILNKLGELTDAEFDEIKTHTSFGEKIIEKIKENTTEHSFLEHAKIFAGYHHEKWDGSGYQRGLKGTEIPLEGRLMAIVDVYDALISKRPYKEPFSHEKALEAIVDGKGKHFDPVLVDIFIGCSDDIKEIAETKQ